MLTGESEGLRAIKLIVLASSVRQYIESTIPSAAQFLNEQLGSVAGMVRAGLGITVYRRSRCSTLNTRTWPSVVD
jgi:hypothetical protein